MRAVVFLGMALIAAAVFYPLSVRPGSLLVDRYDTLINYWILHWDLHKLATGLDGLFDGNVLYPYRGTLAYSEHMLGVALAALPLAAAGLKGPALFNLILIATFPLCALAVFVWARELGLSRSASVFGAVAFAFSPWRMAQLGHFQLLSAYWMPFCLASCWAYLRDGRRRHLALAGALALMQFLSSFYLAVFLGVGLAMLLGGTALLGPWPGSRRRVPALAALLLLACLPVLPLALPYQKLNRELAFEAPATMVLDLSADPLDFVVPAPTFPLHRRLSAALSPAPPPEGPEHQVFPGIAVYLALLAGLPLAILRPRGPTRRELALLAGLVLAGGLLALGPELQILRRPTGIPMPYGLLSDIAVPLRVVRVPSRFALLAQLGLALLAAAGVDRLQRALGERRPRLATGLALALAGLVVLEIQPIGLEPCELPGGPGTPPEYAYIAQAEDVKAIVDLGDNTLYDGMYYATLHWKPTMNGCSGYLPGTFNPSWAILAAFPDDRALDLLDSLGVSHAIFRPAEWPSETVERVRQHPRLDRRAGGDQAWVLALVPGGAPIALDVRAEVPDTVPSLEPWTLRLRLTNRTGRHAFLAPNLCRVKITLSEGEARILELADDRFLPFEIGPREEARLDWPIEPVSWSQGLVWEVAWETESRLVPPGRQSGALSVVDRIAATSEPRPGAGDWEYVGPAPLLVPGRRAAAAYLVANRTARRWRAGAVLTDLPQPAWLDAGGGLVGAASMAMNGLVLGDAVLPGQSVRMLLPLAVPSEPGRYRLSSGLAGPAADETREVLVDRIFEPLPPGTQVSASHAPAAAAHALDGDPTTRWTSVAPMVPGMWFEIDFPEMTHLAALQLDSAGAPGDEPRGLEVTVRDEEDGPYIEIDGVRFEGLPGDGAVVLTFPPMDVLAIRLEQLGEASNYWSIYELALRADP